MSLSFTEYVQVGFGILSYYYSPMIFHLQNNSSCNNITRTMWTDIIVHVHVQVDFFSSIKLFYGANIFLNMKQQIT